METAETLPRSHPLAHAPAAWLSAFFVLNLAAPFFNIPNRATAVIGVIAMTIAYVSVAVLFAVSVTRKKLSVPALLGWGVLALALWLLIENLLGPAVIKPIIEAARTTRTRPVGVDLLQIIAMSTLSDMALLSLGVVAGNLGAKMIRTPNMLGPILVVIALIDIWGVLFQGILHQIMISAPQVAAKAMTSGPRLGAATGSAFRIGLPDIGIGDYLFIGLLLGAIFYLNLNWKDTVKWMVPLVCAALISITLLPQVPALPGLPFIALAAAIPNWRAFKYTREERFALIYAGILVVVLTLGLYWGAKTYLPKPPPHEVPRATKNN